MLIVRKEQLNRFGSILFETYVKRLTEQLSGETYAAARQRLFPAGHSREEMAKFIRASIARARSFGFECEGDITPFVAMDFVLDDVFKNTGLYDWIEAILIATELAAQDRMDAIYDLMPEQERALCFDHFQGQ